MDTLTVRESQKEATRLLRQYRTADPGDRTRILRRLAEILVDLRGLFYTADGLPDWTGKGKDYRQAIEGLYGEAGMTPEESRTVSAATRYHVSNVLRERLSRDELADLGLRPIAARERAREQRDARRAVVAAITGKGGPITDGEAALRAVIAAQTFIARVDVSALRSLTPEGVESAVRSLRALSRSASRKASTLAE